MQNKKKKSDFLTNALLLNIPTTSQWTDNKWKYLALVLLSEINITNVALNSFKRKKSRAKFEKS